MQARADQARLARERSLREAASALLVATDVAGVVAAVRTAVAELLPAGVPHEVLFGGADDVSAHVSPVL